MEKTLEIKGMMCPHCEATVRTALEALPQVQEAQVSHQTGTAVVTLTAPVEDDTLRRTVEDKGYTVTAIRDPTAVPPQGGAKKPRRLQAFCQKWAKPIFDSIKKSTAQAVLFSYKSSAERGSQQP